MVLKFVVMVIVFAQILFPITEAAQGRAVYYNPPYTSEYTQLYIYNIPMSLYIVNH